MKRLISAALTLVTALMLTATPALANHSEDRDCADFDSQSQAQAFFERHSGSRTQNVDRLDADSDGRACENQEYGPSGGNPDTDDDGDDPGDGDLPDTAVGAATTGGPLPVILSLLGFVTFGLVLRRRIGVPS